MIASPRHRSKWQMIWTMAAKDLEDWWKSILVALVVACIVAGFVGVSARPPGHGTTYEMVWTWSNVSAIYAIATLLTSLAIGLSFAANYGGEIKSGTVRALILYPIDMNHLTMAKLLSSCMIGVTEAAMLFFISLAPLFAYGIIPFGGATIIFFAAAVTTVFIVFTGSFLAHIVTYFANRAIISPSTLVGFMLLLAIVTTQQGANAIGIVALFIRVVFGGGYVTSQDLDALWGTSGAISILSPHHAAATVLTTLLGPQGHFPDVYFVLPAGIILIMLGVMLGRKIYLDVFIR